MNTTLTEKTADGSYVDWPAIFAGTVVAVAIGLLLTTFGAALGLSSITLDGTDNSSTLELVLTALWMVITLVASYLAGGYVAGRMRRRVESATDDEVTARDGINGLVVWGLGSVNTAVLLSSALSFAANTAGNVAAGAGKAAGTVVEAAGSAVGGAASGLADAAGAAIPDEAKNDPTDYLSNQLLRPNQVDPLTADPEQLAEQTASIVANIYRTGEVSEEDRTYLAGAVAAQQRGDAALGHLDLGLQRRDRHVGDDLVDGALERITRGRKFIRRSSAEVTRAGLRVPICPRHFHAIEIGEE